MDGWVKIHRKFLDWEWYDDINTRATFFHLLLIANYEEKSWKGQMVKRGQLITSIKHLAENVGLSVQEVRTSLDKLKSTNEITIEATNRYTIITIVKYDDYQVNEGKSNKQNNTRNNRWATNK